MDNWREKERTAAEVRVFIHNFPWDDKSGLPSDAYKQDEVEEKAALVFDHVRGQYPAPACAPARCNKLDKPGKFTRSVVSWI